MGLNCEAAPENDQQAAAAAENKYHDERQKTAGGRKSTATVLQEKTADCCSPAVAMKPGDEHKMDVAEHKMDDTEHFEDVAIVEEGETERRFEVPDGMLESLLKFAVDSEQEQSSFL